MGPGPAQGEGRGRGAPAPPPRLSHASSPRARAVAPEPAPPERLRAPGVSLRPPQHNHPGNGGPPAPLAGGPRALLASGVASAARFYLRSDFDAKNRAGARASLGGWARARARVTCHWVCVCVFPCACWGLARLCLARRPARGVQGWILLRGPGPQQPLGGARWAGRWARGRAAGAPAGAGVGSSALPQGPPPSAPTARSWPRPAAGGSGCGSAPLC